MQKKVLLLLLAAYRSWMIPNKPTRSNSANFPFTSRHVGDGCLGLAAIVLFQVERTHPWVTPNQVTLRSKAW